MNFMILATNDINECTSSCYFPNLTLHTGQPPRLSVKIITNPLRLASAGKMAEEKPTEVGSRAKYIAALERESKCASKIRVAD